MKNKYLNLLKSYWASILVITIVGFALGYFIIHGVVNPYFMRYEVTVNTPKASDYFTLEYFDNYYEEFNSYNTSVEEHNNNALESNKKLGFDIDYASVKEYNTKVGEAGIDGLITLKSKKTLASIDYKGMLDGIKIEDGEEVSKVYIQTKYFQDIFSNSKADVTIGRDRIATYLNKVFDGDITVEKEITDNMQNPYLYAGILGFVFLVGYVTLIFVYYSKTDGNINIADNEVIFNSPFHKRYWSLSLKPFREVKSLVTIAIMFSLMLVCKLFPLPSGFGDLGIGITYLVFSSISMAFGPVVGIVIGFLSDILGFLFFQSGAMFFPGYTLDAMLAGFIYGIFFYRTKVTYAKCLYARILVNLFVNVVLGSCWYQFVYMGGFDIEVYKTYILFISLPKNLLYLLPQSILLFIILKALARPMKQAGLIDERISSNMTLI